jgi:hypothetical protein
MLRAKGAYGGAKSAGATRKGENEPSSPADEDSWVDAATFSPWEWQRGLRTSQPAANGNNELVIADPGFSLLKPFSNLLCSIRRKVKANENMGNLQVRFRIMI